MVYQQNELKENCLDLIKACKINNKYNQFKKNGYVISDKLEVDNQWAISIFDLYDYDIHLMNECAKINNNQYQRYKRTKEKLLSMYCSIVCKNSGYMYFVTLTFNDDVFSKTTIKTRRRYVTRFLNDNSIVYIANIDYGMQNEREHYHAVILTEFKLDYEKLAIEWQKTLNESQYVQISIENIAITENSLNAIPKYLNKLSNHSYKDTTTQYALYSKQFDYKLDQFRRWDTILDTMPLPFDV